MKITPLRLQRGVVGLILYALIAFLYYYYFKDKIDIVIIIIFAIVGTVIGWLSAVNKEKKENA